tara:strand:- start:644 stop:1192 length:549 start_codon:yes stop_codon:yes gene_type:complete
MPELNPSVSVNVSDVTPTSGLNNLNLLQPNAFKLIIDRKNFSNLEFFAQAVIHPDISVQAADVAYQRISSIAMAGDKLTFGELSAMIILDENLNSYIEMYNWVNRLVESNDRTPINRDVAKPPTYCDITLSILSSHNNQTRKVKYIDCVPTGLGNISFESTSGGEAFITYPANFRFSYFEIE